MIKSLFVLSLGATSALRVRAASPACGPMHDAMLKLYSTPLHVYSTDDAAYAWGLI